MSTALPVREHRVVLHDITWDTYQHLRAVNRNGGLRMTYDRGELEIMSPSRKHERVSYLIGRMIDEWTVLTGTAVEAGRNTTFSRQDLNRGLEPDNCYWIAYQADVRGKEEIDLAIDPPPDLALEVDVTRSSIPKLPIYQALGVPEVWRWRFGMLELLTLDVNGQYAQQPASAALPGFPLQLVEQFLERSEHEDDTALIRRFRKTIADLERP